MYYRGRTQTISIVAVRRTLALTSALSLACLAAGAVPARLRAHQDASDVAKAPPRSGSAVDPRPVLDRYCVTCHNDRLKTAGLALDALDLARVGEHGERWERVVRKLRTGAMPPPGAPRPDQATYDSLAGWLEASLDRSAAERPSPGRPTIHRLNRTEYVNAVRDLLALDIAGRSLFPADR